MIETANQPVSDPMYAASEVIMTAIRTHAEQFDASFRLPPGTTYRLMSCGRGLIDNEELEVLAYILHDLNQCYDATCVA